MRQVQNKEDRKDSCPENGVQEHGARYFDTIARPARLRRLQSPLVGKGPVMNINTPRGLIFAGSNMRNPKIGADKRMKDESNYLQV